MKGISINGNQLHKITMPLEQYKNCNSIISLQYPKNRILFEQYDEGVLKLKIPSNLALEMYRIGVLPQNQNEFFSVRINGKAIGNYKVIDFLYPNTINDDIVFITLQKQ